MIFINISQSWDGASQCLFYEFTPWSRQRIFSSEKKANHVWMERYSSSSKSFESAVFLLIFYVLWWKLALSYLVWEIPNVFMHYLSNKKLRHSHIRRYEPGWLTGIVVNHGLTWLNKFGSSLIRTISLQTVVPS